MEKVAAYTRCSRSHQLFAMSISEIKEPTTSKQAAKDEKRIEEIQVEINSLEANLTWVLSELPNGKTLVDGKWVYKVTFNADGSVERYNARLMACGYT